MTATLDLTTRRTGEVSRAARALAMHARKDPFGHKRLHEELRAGNPYLHAFLARRGLVFERGAIRQTMTKGEK